MFPAHRQPPELPCAPHAVSRLRCWSTTSTEQPGPVGKIWQEPLRRLRAAPPDGSGQVVCAARSSNGGLSYSIFNGSVWSTEALVTGSLASGPSCATLGGGRVLCAARSASGGLTSSVFSGTAWGAFTNHAASTTSAPGCASDDAGRVVCMMQDTSSHELVIRYNGTAWEG